MNLDYLKNFLVLIEFMNFTKAAEHLFIVPSTLSSQIHSLEEEFGTPLFLRDKHFSSDLAIVEIDNYAIEHKESLIFGHIILG